MFLLYWQDKQACGHKKLYYSGKNYGELLTFKVKIEDYLRIEEGS